MKTISIINLKGGVAKTLTADSMAHVLATLHNKRVLLVDNDKQGNTSKAFGVHSYDDKSISDVLTARRLDPREVIKKTRFENIDVMPANMTLIRANMEVLMDSTRPQQTRLRSALNAIAEENFYDFCIIDNAPDINISTIQRYSITPANTPTLWNSGLTGCVTKAPSSLMTAAHRTGKSRLRTM